MRLYGSSYESVKKQELLTKSEKDVIILRNQRYEEIKNIKENEEHSLNKKKNKGNDMSNHM